MKTFIVIAKYAKASLIVLGYGPLSHQALQFLGEGVRGKMICRQKKLKSLQSLAQCFSLLWHEYLVVSE